jgi:hypothetical protein
MKRRNFLHNTVAVGALSSLTAAAQTGPKKGRGREYYELRVYSVASAEKQALLDEYLQHTALPAYAKLGIKNVGAFKALDDAANHAVYLLIPYTSMEQFVTATAKAGGDLAYGAPATYAGVPMKDPVYDRIESSLLLAFEGMPQMKVPAKKDRIFELRIYESHNEKAGKQKVKMFNAGGEIAIFNQTGLTPVFFGEALVGTRLPNLTYMLTFDNMEARDRNWKQFGSHPDWVKLKDQPEYVDTVSKITNIFLAPAAYSQV